MASFVIFSSDVYQVASVEQGLAYEIKRHRDGASVLLQGEECSEFRQNLEDSDSVGAADYMLSHYDCVLR